jgi:C-terminal processing protease CtpA/Prc
MQKIIKWFTPVVALGVAIFIVFFLISINSKVELGETQALTLESENNTTQSEKIWIDHFSQTQRKGYSYPVNEVYIKVDLDEKITKTITYKLKASLLDPYQTFCLKEELKQHKLKYFLKQDKKGMELLIYSQNVDKLNSLVKVLRNYKISASVKPYKEEY